MRTLDARKYRLKGRSPSPEGDGTELWTFESLPDPSLKDFTMCFVMTSEARLVSARTVKYFTKSGEVKETLRSAALEAT